MTQLKSVNFNKRKLKWHISRVFPITSGLCVCSVTTRESLGTQGAKVGKYCHLWLDCSPVIFVTTSDFIPPPDAPPRPSPHPHPETLMLPGLKFPCMLQQYCDKQKQTLGFGVWKSKVHPVVDKRWRRMRVLFKFLGDNFLVWGREREKKKWTRVDAGRRFWEAALNPAGSQNHLRGESGVGRRKERLPYRYSGRGWSRGTCAPNFAVESRVSNASFPTPPWTENRGADKVWLLSQEL